MKRCPQCNAVYGVETQYCLNDGAVLTEDAAPETNFNDEDEEETIIRHDPIVVDVAQQNESVYQNPPITNRPTIIVEKERNTGKYLLFLIAGLVLGGALVLAGLFIARNLNQNENTANVNTNNKTQPEKVAVSNSNRNANFSNANANLAQNNANSTEANAVHEEKTSADDADFNGRVITLNAYVRSAPSKTSAQVSILPKDDRIKIGERANPNSPWYKVTCEHGISGWMHGDTIEFTESN